MLKFADGSQVAVMGLNEIMAELCAEGRQPGDETAQEIMTRLEERKNFIPASENVRRDYASVLLRKYRNYLKDRTASSRQHRP